MTMKCELLKGEQEFFKAENRNFGQHYDHYGCLSRCTNQVLTGSVLLIQNAN